MPDDKPSYWKLLNAYLFTRFLLTMAYQIFAVVVGWQVYSIRKNPLDLGWVGLAQFIPMLSFSLLGGQLADRHSRKKIMLVTHFLFGLSVLALGAATYLKFVHLEIFLVMLFIQGVLRAFSNPATQAFITQLVPTHDLKKAVALNSSVWQTSTIIGPMIGGFAFAWAGRADLIYLGCALSVFSALLVLSTVKAKPNEVSRDRVTLETLLAGVKFVLKKQIVLGAISLDLFAVLFGGATALLPAYAADILHAGPRGLGLLRAAPGLGAILMSLILAVRPLKNHLGFWLFFNVALFGIATIGFGLSTVMWFSLVCLFVVGASDVVSVVIRMTMVQLETPPTMRGRVSAVNSIFISASNELGEFESGLTAAWFGMVPSVVLGGAASILVSLLWSYWFPELRGMEKLSDT